MSALDDVAAEMTRRKAPISEACKELAGKARAAYRKHLVRMAAAMVGEIERLDGPAKKAK